MKKIDQWLSEYGESHQNQTNKAVHWICVPLIMFSLIGLLWSIPTPEVFHNSSFPVNFGTLFLFLALCYYLMLSVKLTMGMLVISAFIVAGNYQLAQIEAVPLWLISLLIFAAAWVGQFIGHNIEGKKPSFLKDLQFLLIGPLWTIAFLYRKMGVSY
ncbi:MAG: Mpo1-like protein [Bacteroidota bacterium]